MSQESFEALIFLIFFRSIPFSTMLILDAGTFRDLIRSFFVLVEIAIILSGRELECFSMNAPIRPFFPMYSCQ